MSTRVEKLIEDFKSNLKEVATNHTEASEKVNIVEKLSKNFTIPISSKISIEDKIPFRDKKGRFISEKKLISCETLNANIKSKNDNVVYEEKKCEYSEIEVDKIIKSVDSELKSIVNNVTKQVKNKFLKKQTDKYCNESVLLVNGLEYSIAKHILLSKFMTKVTDLLKKNLEVPMVQIYSESPEALKCCDLDCDEDIAPGEKTQIRNFKEQTKNNIKSDFKIATSKTILNTYKYPKLRQDQTKNKEDIYRVIKDEVKERISNDDFIDSSENVIMHKQSIKEIEKLTGKKFKKS